MKQLVLGSLFIRYQRAEVMALFVQI